MSGVVRQMGHGVEIRLFAKVFDLFFLFSAVNIS